MKNEVMYFLIGMALCTRAKADLLGLSNPADIAGMKDFSVYSSGNFFAGSDYTPVKQFTGNWNGPYTPQPGRNLSLSEGRVEAGATYGSWRIAALYREEVVVESNRDMTNIAYYNKQHLPVSPGQNFAINLNMQGFEARGVRLDKGFLFEGNGGTRYSLGAGLSLLDGTRVRMTNAYGVAASTLTGYTYNATLQDANSKASYPFISNATPVGRGYAMDLGAKISWKNGSRLDLAANDLLGQMRWYNMPYTMETANSATLTRNAAGYISYNPTLQGFNDIHRRTIVQNLMTKVSADYTHPFQKVDLTAGTDWIAGYWLPQAGLAYHLGSDWKASMNYDLRFRSVGFGIRNRWFHLDLLTDNTNLNMANAVGFDAGINLSF